MSGHAHPIMTGILIGMWATPTMTLDHLLFAAGATVYVWIGVFFEERSLLGYRGLERLAVRDEATCLGRPVYQSLSLPIQTNRSSTHLSSCAVPHA